MEAADSIYNRRLTCGYGWLDDLPLDNPAGVVNWVLTHQDVPRPILAADAQDALVIVAHILTEAERLEFAAIKVARSARVPWSHIAARLGLRSAQGAEQRYLRLASERRPSDKDDKGPRDAKRERREQLRDARRRQEELLKRTWPDRNAQRVWATATAVLGAMDGRAWWSDGAADYAEELRLLLGDRDAAPAAILGQLGPLARGWKRSPTAPDLPALADALALADEWDANR